MASSRYRSRYNQNQGVPNALPVVDPWWLRLLKVASPTMAQAVAARYAQDSASGQIPRTGDDTYATKIQSQWRSGGARGGHANPLHPLGAQPNVGEQWPGEPGGRWVPTSRIFRRDPRPASITPRPAFGIDPRYNAPIRLSSATGNTRDDGLPATMAIWPNMTRPTRIVRQHRLGLTMMAGPSQRGQHQTWSDQGGIVIAPPPAGLSRQSNKNNARAIQGILARNIGTGRNRIPAVFTPKQAQ